MITAPPYVVHRPQQVIGTDQGFDIGDVKWQAHDTPLSANWAVPQGQAISRTTYAVLFSKLGTSYGVGDGSTTFNLPNLVGAQIEGVVNNAARAQKAADSHSHTKSGAVASANATHQHGAATTGGSPANHDHNTFDGASPSVTGGVNSDMTHNHGINNDNASHSHTDTLAYAAASVSSVTKLIPMMRLL